MVNTIQKRKRSSLDATIGDEKEEDVQGNAKSSKREMTADSVLVENDVGMPTPSVSVDSQECASPLFDDPLKSEIETPNVLDENISKSVTSTAHKQILQQQWSTEAHGHLLRGQATYMQEESIGTEILSENHPGVLSSSPKRAAVSPKATKHPKTTNTVTSQQKSLLRQPETNNTDKDKGKEKEMEMKLAAPKPVKGKVTTVGSIHNIPEVDTSEVTESSASSSSITQAYSTSSAGNTEISKNDIPLPVPVPVPVVESPKGVGKKKVAFPRISILAVIAVLLFVGSFVLKSRVNPGNLIGVVVDDIEPLETLLAQVSPVKTETENELLIKSTHLMQQLSGLEHEATLLIDILDRADASEVEAERIQADKVAEMLQFKQDVDNRLVALEATLTTLQERTVGVEESVLDNQARTRDTVTAGKAAAQEEEQSILPADLVERLDLVIEQITETLEPESVVGDIVEDVAPTADADVVSEGLPIDYEDEEASKAVAAAEAALSALEDKMTESAEALSRAVKEHMLALEEAAMASKAATEAAALEFVRQSNEAALVAAKEAAEVAAIAARARAVAEAEMEMETEAAIDELAADEIDETEYIEEPVDSIEETVIIENPEETETETEADMMRGGLVRLNYLDLDYAVWPRGGRVMPPGVYTKYFGETLALTSPPYILSLGPLKRLRYKLHLDREGADENVLISHSSGREQEEGGQYSCFSLAGSSGTATVTMHSLVKVSAVQIIYRMKADGKDKGASAPKVIRLIGWTEVPSSSTQTEGIDLGVFTYKLAKDTEEDDGMQTFALKDSVPPLRAVTVRVLSNYGDKGHTNICRVKVMGHLEN